MAKEAHWEVEIRINGESVLTIGHNHLAGDSDIDKHADTIRTCANHLLSFIGPEKPKEPERPSRRADWHYDRNGYCDNPGRGY